jgi:Family of unknown function (DUF5946)
VPPAPSFQPTETCPGCGAVLVSPPPGGSLHPGASPACSRLFEVTLLGVREETAADASAAATVRLADAAYDAQHPAPGDASRLDDALDRLGTSIGGGPVGTVGATPVAWRTTIADVAADLDVIDLGVLVEAWARSVHEDWTSPAAARR